MVTDDFRKFFFVVYADDENLMFKCIIIGVKAHTSESVLYIFMCKSFHL